MIGQNVERLAALAREGPAVRIVREPVQRLLARQVLDVVQAATAAASIGSFAHEFVGRLSAEDLRNVDCGSATISQSRQSNILGRLRLLSARRRALQARARSHASFELHQPFTTPLKLAKVRRSLLSGTPNASLKGVSKSATDRTRCSVCT